MRFSIKKIRKIKEIKKIKTIKKSKKSDFSHSPLGRQLVIEYDDDWAFDFPTQLL